MRFMRPYRGLIAVTLFVLLIDNVGTLLVPTMLANMVNTGITTGDVDYILRNGLYMLIATGMASGGAVLGCYLSARLAANVACDIRNAVYDKSLELSASDFERFGTGSMITRSLNDINVIQQAILQTIQLVLPVPFWPWRASSSLGISIPPWARCWVQSWRLYWWRRSLRSPTRRRFLCACRVLSTV